MNYQELCERDQNNPKRIAVVGDTILDEWIEVEEFVSQDNCPSVRLRDVRLCPGGAAGVARQFEHWHSLATLLSPASNRLLQSLHATAKRVDHYAIFSVPSVSVKTRYHTRSGKIIFRSDADCFDYHLPYPGATLAQIRDLVIKSLCNNPWDAILLVDYEKGFLSDPFIQKVVALALDRNILVIADPKRPPNHFEGALLKINLPYSVKHKSAFDTYDVARVITRGEDTPRVHLHGGAAALRPLLRPVDCRNHVGAGDCFLAHLALGLLHGLSCEEAALFAHHAGRVYVQFLYGRPPHPEEIKKDYEATTDKSLCH